MAQKYITTYTINDTNSELPPPKLGETCYHEKDDTYFAVRSRYSSQGLYLVWVNVEDPDAFFSASNVYPTIGICAACNHQIFPLEKYTIQNAYAQDVPKKLYHTSCYEDQLNFLKRLSDPVNPSHYKRGGFELNDILAAWNLHKDAYLFNVATYVFRSAFKGTELEDLEKAKWYLEAKIKELKKTPYPKATAFAAQAVKKEDSF